MRKKWAIPVVLSATLLLMNYPAYAAHYEFTHTNGTKVTPGEVIAQGRAGEIIAQKESYQIELKDGNRYSLASYLKALQENPRATEDEILQKIKNPDSDSKPLEVEEIL